MRVVIYNGSKARIEGLTRVYASRTAKDGLTVNAIAPGLIDTEMSAFLKAGCVEIRILAGSMGQAEDVAHAAVIGNGLSPARPSR